MPNFYILFKKIARTAISPSPYTGERGEGNLVPMEAREGGKGERQLLFWRGESTFIPVVVPENEEENLSRGALISAGRPTLKISCAQVLA